MDHLQKAKDIAAGSGRSSDLERGQLLAGIALVEVANDMARKLDLINAKLNALVKQGKAKTKKVARAKGASGKSGKE